LHQQEFDTFNIDIFSSTGKLVHDKAISQSTNTVTLDLQFLAKGIYFTKIIGNKDNTVHFKKIIKQ